MCAPVDQYFHKTALEGQIDHKSIKVINRSQVCFFSRPTPDRFQTNIHLEGFSSFLAPYFAKAKLAGTGETVWKVETCQMENLGGHLMYINTDGRQITGNTNTSIITVE